MRILILLLGLEVAMCGLASQGKDVFETVKGAFDGLRKAHDAMSGP